MPSLLQTLFHTGLVLAEGHPPAVQPPAEGVGTYDYGEQVAPSVLGACQALDIQGRFIEGRDKDGPRGLAASLASTALPLWRGEVYRGPMSCLSALATLWDPYLDCFPDVTPRSPHSHPWITCYTDRETEARGRDMICQGCRTSSLICGLFWSLDPSPGIIITTRWGGSSYYTPSRFGRRWGHGPGAKGRETLAKIPAGQAWAGHMETLWTCFPS